MMDVMPSVKKLVNRIRRHDRNLADQVARAASSVVPCHAEPTAPKEGTTARAFERRTGRCPRRAKR